ncbi:hypothetical protein NQ315_015377 [Exocentrus adspersus]|uniref:RNase H type-1 domain-containing protein n=1 Tax=Exocentrus adspersus TaxID=1586481 RepID=A0AAV8VKM5_9CUCU|nr:hypothetical protein NQ315_015377 [Exocentrus adspersus]
MLRGPDGGRRVALPVPLALKGSGSRGETPPSVQQALKRARMPTTYSQAANSALRVAVAGEDFPAARLSAEFCDALHLALSRAIDALPVEGSMPRFNEFRLTEQGIIMVTCFDERSKEWLTSQVGSMSPFRETGIRILEGEALPRLRKMVAFVPGPSEEGVDLLRRIERSTPELRTRFWKIRQVIGVPGRGTRLILGVDEESAVALQGLNFVGHAGMSRVTFWDPRHHKGDPGADEAPPTEAPVGATEGSASQASEEPAQDLVAIKVTVGRSCYILCSAYLPYESPSPSPRQLMELVEWCKSNNLPLIVGCDANAHHTCWGSKDVNQRGQDLLEFLISSGLDILNRGTKPTFVTRNRQEVIDITISNSWSSHLVTNWRVSSEVSMSDHRHILFNLETGAVPEEREYRHPKLTVWSTYKDILSRNVGPPVRPHTIPQIESSVKNLTKAVVHAYEQSCPVRKVRSRHSVPWWNPELLTLRKKARALFNRAMRTRTNADWDLYKEAQRQFKSCIKRSKRGAWKEFCESIEELPAASKIHKVLKKDQDCKINDLRLPDGTYTCTDRETLELLLRSQAEKSGTGTRMLSCHMGSSGSQMDPRHLRVLGPVSGACVLGWNCFPLGKHASVFQAEVFAISACVSENLKRGYSNQHIQICTDSQAALHALKSPRITSQVVLECTNSLAALGQRNKVRLVWVPGHSGVAGNEEADVLARKGASDTLTGPEPAIGLPYSYPLGSIDNWTREKCQGDWSRGDRVAAGQAPD